LNSLAPFLLLFLLRGYNRKLDIRLLFHYFLSPIRQIVLVHLKLVVLLLPKVIINNNNNKRKDPTTTRLANVKMMTKSSSSRVNSLHCIAA
jgi:hypothetical protein